MVAGKNPVAAATVRARTTSRCGRAAGIRTPADRDPDLTENKRASFGTPFLLRPVAVNRELPDSSPWCGCLGGDQHHPVRSVRTVIPERGVAFDHPHRRNLISGQIGDLVALESDPIDDI